MVKCLDLNHALKYAWPHFDYGKAQTSAWWGGDGHYTLEHGQVTEFTDGLGSKGKCTFRLIEKDLDKEFLSEAIPLLKEWWEHKRMEKLNEHK